MIDYIILLVLSKLLIAKAIELKFFDCVGYGFSRESRLFIVVFLVRCGNRHHTDTNGTSVVGVRVGFAASRFESVKQAAS